MFQAYSIIGVLETLCSFTMSDWYLQRCGIPFSDLWFGYGSLPDSIDVEYAAARLNEASSCESSRYAMFYLNDTSYAPSKCFPTPSSVQQDDAEPVTLPSYCLRAGHGYFLALYPTITVNSGYEPSSGWAFLLAGCFWMKLENGVWESGQRIF